MKEVIDNLNKKFHEFCNLEQDYQKAMDALVKLEFDNKQAVIDDLRQRRNKADEKMKEYFQAVNALRKVCTHMLPNNFPAFENLNENVEVCSICGYELRRKFADVN
jgi:hypothetical protein